MGKPLDNPKHEMVAQYMADGLSGREAYKKAYRTKPGTGTARKEFRRVAENPLVRARLKELQEERAKEFALTRERKRELLRSIAEDESADLRARISAIQVDNAMTGDNEPVKFAHSGSVSLLVALDQVRNGD